MNDANEVRDLDVTAEDAAAVTGGTRVKQPKVKVPRKVKTPTFHHEPPDPC